jgi:RNA-directed DNA polymerase
MHQNRAAKPAAVAATPQQAGAAAPREPWGWVARGVWTERRLPRLTASEPADRVWFRLWDKTYAPANLHSACDQVWRKGGSAGADEQTVAHFGRHAEAELQRLHEQWRAGTYPPQPVRRAGLAKPGSKEKRPLGIPAVRDRMVPGALRHVLEPIFEADMAEHSYGFRPGRGAKDARRRVDHRLKTGPGWVGEADLKSCFDTMLHARLLALVKARGAAGRVLALGEGFLRAGVLETAKNWQPAERGPPPGGGSVRCGRTWIAIRSPTQGRRRAGRGGATRTTS